jgi:hypothetical protein
MNTDLDTFQAYPKTPRLFREAIITEKLDGTNSSVCIIPEDGYDGTPLPAVASVNGFHLLAGSRTRWITPGKTTDNYGFAQWVFDNAEDLVNLGPGRHFGEWWGQGIQRNYGLKEKRFSLFNVDRWQDGATKTHPNGSVESLSPRPKCCDVVPVFWRGVFSEFDVQAAIAALRQRGSWAAPGFMNPEGIIVYHTAAQRCFKVLLENDDKAKGATE